MIELKILKYLISNQSLALEFTSSYSASLFSAKYQILAEAVINYIKAYRTLPTENVLIEHIGAEQVEEIWKELEEISVNPQEFRYYLDLLKNEYSKRKIAEIKEYAGEDDLEITSKVKKIAEDLEKIRQVHSNKRQVYVQKTLKEYMPEFKKEYKEKYTNPEIGKGISTGYSYLDYIVGGLHNQEMLIIGADTGAGKSLLLNNMAIQMWMQNNTIDTLPQNYSKGYNILYFSLEMPYSACARRTLSKLADIPIYGIRDAKLNSFQIENLNKASKFINKYPFNFEIVDFPRGMTIDAMEQRFNSSPIKPDVVVVDYLTLMEDNNTAGESDWLRLGSLSGALHEFARCYNVIVLTAVQLNRNQQGNKKNDDSGANIHRIGRSSLIMHHANIGLMIHSRSDEQNYSDMKIVLLKNRDGQLGSFSLEKKFSNGAIKDIKFEVEEFISTEDIDTNDITNLMEKYGWGKK